INELGLSEAAKRVLVRAFDRGEPYYVCPTPGLWAASQTAVIHAAKVYAERQKLGEEAIQHATAIKVDAMTMMGEMLREAPKAPAGRPLKIGSQEEPISKPPTLAEVGISKKESSDAQYLADLKETDMKTHSEIRNGKKTVRQVRRAKPKEKTAP